MKCVYVAGAYSADNTIDILNNMRRGMRLSTEVFLAGMAPFAPWLDYHYTLMLHDGEALTLDNYYEYSIAWLKKSDAVLVVEGWQNSHGTIRELEIANDCNVPVFYTIEDLIHWGNNDGH